MNQINKDIVNEFSKEIDLSAFQKAYELITQYLNESINIIKQRNPYISDYKIYVANEAFCGTGYFASTLDLFVVFDAVQIELNYNNKPKNTIKNNLKYFWKEFRTHFNFFSSKKKKNEKLLKSTEKRVLSLKNYDVEVLFYDIFLNLTKLLHNTTTIQINGNKLKVIGDEEFGININIYPVFKTQENAFKMYNIYSQKYLTVDFKNRFSNIFAKNVKTQNLYTNQIRIFNNLYWNILKQKPNQIFIESLLFSCPNCLYVGDNLTVTLNLLNYIKNSTMQNMVSVCDNNTQLFKEKLNKTTIDLAIKFINNIKII